MKKFCGMSEGGRYRRTVRAWVGRAGLAAGLVGAYFALQGLVPGRDTLSLGVDAMPIAGLLQWHGRVVREGAGSLASPPFFYPYPDATFRTENFIGVGLLTAPWAGASPEGVYTWAMLLGHWATLLATVYWIEALVERPVVAWLVGVLYTFSYTRVLLGYTHLHVVWNAPGLMALGALVRWWRTGRRVYALGAAAGVVVQVFFSVYFTFYLMMSLVVAGLLGFRSLYRSGRLRSLIGWGLGTGLALGVVLWPYWYQQQLGGLNYVPPNPDWAATLNSLLLVPPGSFWYEHMPRAYQTAVHVGNYGYLAWPGLVLELAFGLSLPRLLRTPLGRVCVGTVVLSAGMAMGPALRLSSTQVGVPNPLFWALAYVWPQSTVFRVFGRWYHGMTLGMALGVALSFPEALVRSAARLPRALRAGVLVLFLVVLFRTDLATRPVLGSDVWWEPVDGLIRRGDVVLEAPTSLIEHVAWDHGARTVPRSVMRGFFTVTAYFSYMPPLSYYLRDATAAMPAPPLEAILEALGVQKVLLHCHSYRWVPRMQEACEAYRRFLTGFGWRVVWDDGRDLLLEAPYGRRPPRMFYDRLDFRVLRVRLEPSRAGGRPDRLVWEADPPAAVGFPDYCYPFEVDAYGADGRRLRRDRSCVTFRQVLVGRVVTPVRIDPGARYLRIRSGRRSDPGVTLYVPGPAAAPLPPREER